MWIVFEDYGNYRICYAYSCYFPQDIYTLSMKSMNFAIEIMRIRYGNKKEEISLQNFISSSLVIRNVA